MKPFVRVLCVDELLVNIDVQFFEAHSEHHSLLHWILARTCVDTLRTVWVNRKNSVAFTATQKDGAF